MRRGLAATATAAALLTVAPLHASSGAAVALTPRSASITPTVFSYTGAWQWYHVPSNVTQIMVQAVGGAGGGAMFAGQYGVDTRGGAAGSVTTLLDVQPGQYLQIMVGGKGQNGGGAPVDNNSAADPEPGPPPRPDYVQPAVGGWNGGGDAGYGAVTYNNEYVTPLYGTYAGGGGGATDIRDCSGAVVGQCGTDSRVIVAAGGGGAGMNAGLSSQFVFVGTSIVGGAGGTGPAGVGQAGESQADLGAQYASAGTGATQSAVGTGGAAAITHWQGQYEDAVDCTQGPNSGAGQPGTATGQGGAGGSGLPVINGGSTTNFGGGGGGGGYYGGGGGGCGGFAWISMSDYGASQQYWPGTAAGGGGSSWANPAKTHDTVYSNTSLTHQDGYVVIQGVTFGSSGATQDFTVPTGVTSLSTTLNGAQGGVQDLNYGTGMGATISGDLSVSPGDVLHVNVGGGGQVAQCQSDVCPLLSLGGAPGYESGNNGGGQAVPSSYTSGWAGQSGGGGATDIRIGGTALANRILVAAGGGGSSLIYPGVLDHNGPGGPGGCTTGGAGSGDSDGGVGGGASQSAGGSGGSSGPSGSSGGANGAYAQGGAGGNGDESADQSREGGGGGGGLYGGGGGGGGGSTGDVVPHSAGAGGGGSSYIDPSLAGFTCTAGTGPQAGQVEQSADGSAVLGFAITVAGVPTNVVAADSGGTGANLTWFADTTFGANISRVVQQTTDGTTWVSSTIASSTDGTATISGLSAVTGYQFRVASVNASGQGPWSRASNWIRTAKTAPTAAPTGLNTSALPNAVQLDWTAVAAANDGGSPITGYAVRMYVDGSLSPTAVTSNSLSTDPTYTVTDLSSAHRYTFEVAAVNDVGTGPYSSASSAITPIGIPTAPGTPTGTAHFESVELSWSAATVAWSVASTGPTQAVTGYQVTVSPDSGATWYAPITTGSASASYTVAPLMKQRAFMFKVRALNGTAVGPWSGNSGLIAPETRSMRPMSLTASAGTSSIALSWAAPDNDGGGTLAGYLIQQRDQSSTANPWTTVVQNTNSTATTATISRLSSSTRYTFRVAAITDVTGAPTPAVLGAFSRPTFGLSPRSGGGGGGGGGSTPSTPESTPPAPAAATPSATPTPAATVPGLPATPQVHAISVTGSKVNIALQPGSSVPVTFQRRAADGAWVSIKGATLSQSLAHTGGVSMRVRAVSGGVNSSAVTIDVGRTSSPKPIAVNVTFDGARSSVTTPKGTDVQMRLVPRGVKRAWHPVTKRQVTLPNITVLRDFGLEFALSQSSTSSAVRIRVRH